MYFHFFPFEHKIWRLYCNSYVGDLIILLSHAKKYGFKPYNCFTQIHIEIILLIGITALLGQMKAYKINSSIQKTYRSTAKIMISFKVAGKWRSIFSIDSIWQVSKTCFDFLILRIRNYRWVQNQWQIEYVQEIGNEILYFCSSNPYFLIEFHFYEYTVFLPIPTF